MRGRGRFRRRFAPSRTRVAASPGLVAAARAAYRRNSLAAPVARRATVRGRVALVTAQQVGQGRIEAAEVEEPQRPAAGEASLGSGGDRTTVEVPVRDVASEVADDVMRIRHDAGVDPPLVDEITLVVSDDAVPSAVLGPSLEELVGPRADADEPEVERPRQRSESRASGWRPSSGTGIEPMRREHDAVLPRQLIEVVDRGEHLDVRIEVRHRRLAPRRRAGGGAGTASPRSPTQYVVHRTPCGGLGRVDRRSSRRGPRTARETWPRRRSPARSSGRWDGGHGRKRPGRRARGR